MCNHKLIIKNLMEKYSFSVKDAEYLKHIYQKKSPLMLIEVCVLKGIIKKLISSQQEKLQMSERYIKEYKNNLECLGLAKQAEHRKLLGKTPNETSLKVSLAIRINLENLKKEQDVKEQIKKEIGYLRWCVKALENKTEKTYC